MISIQKVYRGWRAQMPMYGAYTQHYHSQWEARHQPKLWIGSNFCVILIVDLGCRRALRSLVRRLVDEESPWSHIGADRGFLV
ncbi:hypothetical protein M407DRAFT_207390 [Tulasnella calospora MUT 4182]|uniref:Uncharacterized protein n=1 Tax=Tulasnella calospora MUT 4182 TaxID=1051891 RepID=A0A0C3Q7U9_9AGAM|nr:hypothetical protein M407DRAFT_207390 [Tulasnella calospora MUT 4182]